MQNGTQILLDRTTTANAEYIGKAASGSLTSSSVWSIKKNSYDVDNKPISVLWANGVGSQDLIWDNRARYIYK